MIRRALSFLFVAALWSLTAAVPAAAQANERLPHFVVDLQASVLRLPTDEEIATRRDMDVSWLPKWGVGFNTGAHFYPLRWKLVTFGIGGTYFWGGRTRTQAVVDQEPAPSGPDVTTRLRGFAPQLSFNFGSRDGFSYLSGGIAPSKLTVSREDAAPETGEWVKTINYGGGARWFFNDRLAFSVDLRFYAIAPTEASEKGGGHPRLTQMVASAGISFR